MSEDRDEDCVSYQDYATMRDHALLAYTGMGRWIGRVWALLIAWAITYVILFVAAFRLKEDWLLWAIPAPIIVHFVAERLLVKREEKAFGSSKSEQSKDAA